MSEAFRCDRCGEFQGGDPKATVTTKSGTIMGTMYKPEQGNPPYDLCNECLKDFKQFMEQFK